MICYIICNVNGIINIHYIEEVVFLRSIIRIVILGFVLLLGILLPVPNWRYTGNRVVDPLISQRPLSSVIPTVTETVTSKPTPLPSVQEIDLVKEQIQNMTIDEKIGQLVIIGLEGYTISEDIKKLIVDGHVSGCILFSPNIKNSEQLRSLLNSLKVANKSNKIPMFFSVDQEGGRVNRLPDEIKNIPTNRDLGKINNRDLLYKTGAVIADAIKMYGFNMNFAPVLDIDSNPKNPVIGDRSFGPDAKRVSTLGIQMMKGMQSRNIISVVKHFPGHGDTVIDSHLGLPVVTYDLDRLNRFELVPFKEAIRNHADVIMVAHILLTKLDDKNPASFSKKVITDLLRVDMQYEGVVITDDMTMGAVTQHYNLAEAAVTSIQAGSDIILVCHDYQKELSVITALRNALKQGTLSEERIDKSVYRILQLKKKYNISDQIIDSVDVENINRQINDLFYK